MFDYSNAASVEEVLAGLSAARMAPYLKASKSDAVQALKLYERNTARSSTLYGLLQTLEIVLRNAFDRELSAPFLSRGESWFDHQAGAVSLLRGDEALKIQAAKKQILDKGYSITHGQVIATLSFGFWVSLTEARYSNTLWGPYKLYKVFPGTPKRLTHADANNFLKPFRDLRNRVAHHEPIFSRNFVKDQDGILQAIRSVCPVSADWAARLRLSD